MYGIGEEVFLSLPCVLNGTGVNSVVNMTLTDDEVAQLRKSADTLWAIQKDLRDVWTRLHTHHTTCTCYLYNTAPPLKKKIPVVFKSHHWFVFTSALCYVTIWILIIVWKKHNFFPVTGRLKIMSLCLYYVKCMCHHILCGFLCFIWPGSKTLLRKVNRFVSYNLLVLRSLKTFLPYLSLVLCAGQKTVTWSFLLNLFSSSDRLEETSRNVVLLRA